ncbi:MAG: FAD-binding oxidoreductase [Gemmatimonadaceae bacterium]
MGVVPLVALDLVGAVTAPPDCVRLSPADDEIADYLHDESKLASRAAASLAVPETLEELRRVLAWHAANGHAVAVSGSRTGVTGGAVPEAGAHLVSLAALRGVLSVDEDQEPPTATVLAGTWLSDFTRYLATHHPSLTFPVDPTETSASLGGMVATNAGGARTFRFGAMREWVQAITVELPSARTLSLRRGAGDGGDGTLALDDGGEIRSLELAPIPKPSTKNAIGYGYFPAGEAIDLWVGAEGTLGVVSTVTVRLQRQSEQRLGYLQFFDDVAAAFRFVETVRGDRAMRATAIEFLDRRSHALAAESGKPAVERVLAGRGHAECSVFVEVGFEGDEELEKIADALSKSAVTCGADPNASLAGADEGELRDIRAFRHAVPERINAIISQRREQHRGLHKIATDMAVPDDQLGWVFTRYHEVLGGAGLDYAAFGHVGNNHFHVNILPRDEEELARAKECYLVLAREIVARGGCVAAEHGIGRIKKSFLEVQYPPEVLARFRAVKRWIDPQWRFNRGVLLDP